MARTSVHGGIFLALLVAVGMAACEESDGTGGDVTEVGGTGDPGSGNDPGPGGDLIGSCRSADGGCIESEFDTAQPSTTWDGLEQICTTGGSTWVQAACPTAALLGVCTMPKSNGQTVRNYCYDRGVVPPADQVVYCKTPCDQGGGTWTTP